MKATVSTKSVTESTVMNLSDPDHKDPEESNTVKFKVSFPKGYDGKKHWQDGDVIETSLESAKEFEKMNLGKLIKDSETKDKAEGEDTEDEKEDSENKKSRKKG